MKFVSSLRYLVAHECDGLAIVMVSSRLWVGFVFHIDRLTAPIGAMPLPKYQVNGHSNRNRPFRNEIHIAPDVAKTG